MASKTISTILNLKDNFSNVIKKTTSNTKGFTNGIKESGKEVSEIGLGIKNTFKDIGEAIKNGIGIGAGMDIWNNVKDGISETINFSNDLQKSLNKIQVATGITDEAMSGMKNTMLDIYNDNFGENFEDIGEAIKTISQQTGAKGDDLKDLAENALALKDAFGYEVGESIRGANALMKHFGVTGNEAFNLIAQGKQSGLDYSNEMLDSIMEYSVQFKQLGFSAEDMFEILNNGATDGAFNLDKVGDAVKEFSIRAIDGSNTTIDGFTQLGLNADEMANKFASGGDTAKEAFKQVTKAIKDMDDPVQQSIVGVDLFGTMWEDLGPKVVTQLGDIGDNFSATSDALNQIKKINFNDIGSAFKYIKRNIQTSILVPIGDKVLPKLNEFANWFKQYIPGIKEKVGSIADKFINVGSSIGQKVFPKISELSKSISDLVSTIYNSVVPAFDAVKPDSWQSVSDAIGWIFDKAKEVVDFINNNWSTIEPIIVGITGAVAAWNFALMAVNTWTKIVAATTTVFETIELMIWGVKNATTLWEGAQWLLNAAMSANPIGAVILVVAGLGFAIFQLVKHFKDICEWVEKAWGKLKKFLGLDGSKVNITTTETVTKVSSDSSGNDYSTNIGHNATGTQYWRGGPTRINEHGGEMAVLPSGSKVIPADKTDKLLNNSGHTFKFYFNGNVGTDEFFEEAGEYIKNEIILALANK